MADDGGASGPLLLGIDTGGTYTDAVLIDEARLTAGADAVVARAKRLTTHGALDRGIGRAIDAVLSEASVTARDVALVSLSTTLATNALVEGVGGRVGLVMIGFSAADTARAGLEQALGADPMIRLAGGHDAMGAEQAPLDLAALEPWLAAAPVEGYAVCGHFGVRNPAHEIRVRDAIRTATGRPVTCSHELSPRVGGPRRALTALLNARLIGMIDGLIGAAEALMAERGLSAPLMVVRGDGALVSATFARARPIETILSGPAASLVGAFWLTGIADAIVSDIGGTTTDIAVLRNGRPRLDPEGATVGGWQTMVEAVAMTTHGLGGDSAVSLATDGLSPRLTLGPRRVIPIALLAQEAPALVHETLDRQLARARAEELDGVFLVPGAGSTAGLGPAEFALLDALGGIPAAADRVLLQRRTRAALRRLSGRRLVMTAAITPSDAALVAGVHSGWDRSAAAKALTLAARTRGGDGRTIAASGEALATRILDAVVRRSAELVLDAAFAGDGWTASEPSRSPLAQAALDGHQGLVRPHLGLTVPLIGLGAPAATYYGRVADTLGTTDATPRHADVANAIGAVVGGVRVTLEATITCPEEGRFRLHLPEGVEDARTEAEAESRATSTLDRAVRTAAARAGARDVEVHIRTERRDAEVEGRRMLVEARLVATASGRPALADPVFPADPSAGPARA